MYVCDYCGSVMEHTVQRVTVGRGNYEEEPHEFIYCPKCYREYDIEYGDKKAHAHWVDDKDCKDREPCQVGNQAALSGSFRVPRGSRF